MNQSWNKYNDYSRITNKNSRLFPDLFEIKYNSLKIIEISKEMEKPLQNALKCRFSRENMTDEISRVRYFPAPPFKTAYPLIISELAVFLFGFSRHFPEITAFQTKNPTKSLDLTGLL